MLVGGRERSRRRHDLQRRSIPAAERTWLREEHRRRAGERERSDGDPAKAPVEIHDRLPRMCLVALGCYHRNRIVDSLAYSHVFFLRAESPLCEVRRSIWQ